jgi:hypothetical protein
MSKTKLIIAALLVTSPFSANAELTIWEVTGTLTTVDTPGGFISDFPTATIGSEFSLLLEFESSTLVSSINSGGIWIGSRYRYGDALISMSLSIDGTTLGRTQSGFKLLDIWDDFGFAGTPTNSNCFEPGVACDGFSAAQGLESSQAAGFAQLGLILRGPERLDIYSGPGLPTTPSPLLTSLSTTIVQFVDESDVIIGNVDSVSRVSVPEVLLEQLGAAVTDVGPGKSLANKIMLAQTYLAVPDVQSACAILNGFLNQVRAQRGKKLTAEQADQFTADAEAIIAAIGCD